MLLDNTLQGGHIAGDEDAATNGATDPRVKVVLIPIGERQ